MYRTRWLKVLSVRLNLLFSFSLNWPKPNQSICCNVCLLFVCWSSLVNYALYIINPTCSDCSCHLEATVSSLQTTYKINRHLTKNHTKTNGQMNKNGRKRTETGGNKWKRAKTGRNRWKQAEPGITGWKWAKAGENRWKCLLTGWNWRKQKETNRNRRKRAKTVKNGQKWVEPGANERKWAETGGNGRKPIYQSLQSPNP